MRLTLTPSPVVSSVLKFARSPTSAPRRSSSWITPGWRRRMAPALAVQGLFRPRHLQGSVGSLKKHVPKSVHPAELTREPALRAPSPGRSTGRCPRRGHLPEGRCCLDPSSGEEEHGCLSQSDIVSWRASVPVAATATPNHGGG